MTTDHRSELTTEAGRAAYEAVREVVWYGVKDRFPSALSLVEYVGDQLLKLERAQPLASETTDAGQTCPCTGFCHSTNGACSQACRGQRVVHERVVFPSDDLLEASGGEPERYLAMEAEMRVASETTDAGLTWRCPSCRDTTAPMGMCSKCGVFGLRYESPSSGSIDAERLARAIADGAPLDENDEWWTSPRDFANAIAERYARLSESVE